MAKRFSKSRPKVGDLRLFPLLLVLLLIFLSFLVGRFSKETTTSLPEKEKEEEKTGEDLKKGEVAHRGTVKYVIDGDTIELENGEKVRYLGINTPEKGRPFSTEATEQNKKLVDGQEIGLELDVQSKDQYGRTLAYVWLGGTMVNLELLRLGYANVYTVPPNVRYQDQFLAAEREAREAERGLWTKTLGLSEAAVKIVNLNAEAPEWVEIKNTGGSTTGLNGWTLKDEANHFYTFGDFSLAPDASVFIYSEAGIDTQTELYWHSPKTAVWNDSGDTAFLRDASGNLVDSYKY